MKSNALNVSFLVHPSQFSDSATHWWARMKCVFLPAFNLTVPAKWLYATLWSFANNNHGGIYPSYKTIMRRSGLKNNAIAKALAELEHFKWIVRDKTKSKGNDYVLFCPLHSNSETGEEVKDQYYPTEDMAIEWASRKRSRGKTEAPRLSKELKEKLKRWFYASSASDKNTRDSSKKIGTW